MRQVFWALGAFVAPMATIWLASRMIVPPELPSVIAVPSRTVEAAAAAALVKDAAATLVAASQWLGTITVSTLAAGGVVVFKERGAHPGLCRLFGSIGFVAGIASMLYACALIYWTTLGITTRTHDMRAIADLFTYQAVFALLLASALAALLAGGTARE